jgi:preprotein translocase subunit SecF
VSLAFIIFSAVVLKAKGLNFGVDFLGGIKLVYKFSSPVGEGPIRNQLESLSLGDAQVVRFGEVKLNEYLVRVKFQEGRKLSDEISAKLKELDPTASIISEENVGPKVGAELRKRGVLAVILTWILILVYIGIRFDFLFAPGGIIALIHDVFIPVGFFAFLGKEFNLPILAALLTIIGYSINDTIVIYDRVRENLKKLPAGMPLTEVLNRSLTETMSRTLVTSLTVFFVMVVLFFMGGAVLHDFAFCMLVGVVFGTYSTIFIACPVYLGLQNLFPEKGMTRNTRKR